MFLGGFGSKIEIESHHCHLKPLLDSDVYLLIHKQMFTKYFDKKIVLFTSFGSKMWLAMVSDPVFDLCSMFPVLSLQEQHFKIPKIESIPTLHIKVYPTSLLCSFVKRVQAFEKNVFKILSSLKKHTLYIQENLINFKKKSRRSKTKKLREIRYIKLLNKFVFNLNFKRKGSPKICIIKCIRHILLKLT